MTELLSPAGNPESFKAAVANGANAIYLGGKSFNARVSAGNFEDGELSDAIGLAHFYGVKVYLTLNTLLHDQELPLALAYLAKAVDMGIDAVIIQDTGLLRLIKQALPGLPVHASTQMTLTNSAGVNLLGAEGVCRAILARELSLAELAATQKASRIPLEVFVHGALCICYSGQCLLSSFIGARSGNRGNCAQPCRMEYSLCDQNGQEQGKAQGSYLLSPKDLYGFMELPALHELGLASWKIEGRMKRPEYTAIVTRAYREFLDALEAGEIPPDRERLLSELLQVFNRDYGTGYWQGNPGGDLISWQRPNNRGVFIGRISSLEGGKLALKLESPLNLGDGLEIWVKVGGRQGFVVEALDIAGQPVSHGEKGQLVTVAFQGNARVGDRVFKTSDRVLLEGAKASWENLPQRALKLELSARLGQPLVIKAQDQEGFGAEYSDEYLVEKAQTSPSSTEQVRAQLGRLGGSHYYLADLKAEIEEGVILPKSVLNRCRRAVVEDLTNQRRGKRTGYPDRSALDRTLKELQQGPPKKRRVKPKLTVLAATQEQALEAAKSGVAEIYLTAEGYSKTAKPLDFKQSLAKVRACGGELIPALPLIFHESQEKYWLEQLSQWESAGAAGVLTPSLGALGLAKKYGWQGLLYGGQALNVLNSQAALFFYEQGLKRICLSPELNLEQLQALADLPLAKEFTIGGAMPLMVSEYCPLGAVTGGRTKTEKCSMPCLKQEIFLLKDKKGYAFPGRTDDQCRLHLFNSRELCLGEDVSKISGAGVEFLRLDLRLTALKDQNALILLYQRILAEDIDKSELESLLASLNRWGYTKGHLYRGV